MPEPSEYLIVRNLQTALLAIAVASGYHFGVAALTVKLDPNHDVESLIAPDGPRPFVIIEVKPDTWEYTHANRIARLVLPMTIHWVSDSDPTVDESRLQTYFQGCSDVERAIAKDISRGGLAIDTRILTRTYDTVVDGKQIWAQVHIEISTKRIYGQPDA